MSTLKELIVREVSRIGGQIQGDYALIHCPWHQDTHPSLRVSLLDEKLGLFNCFACDEGKGSYNKLARKLNLEIHDPKALGEELKPRILPLMAGNVENSLDNPTGKVGIVSQDPWLWKEFGYREIRPENLIYDKYLIYKTFKPSLVRLYISNKGKFHQEHFQRLCLSYGDYHVFLRLSSQQEIKTYNSPNLNIKSPSLHPFGLTSSWQIPKNQAGLILVEGPYDLMRTVQNLQDLGIGESFTVLALLGVSHWDSFLSKLEMRLLPQMTNTPIIFMFDNDRAGYALTAKAKADCLNKLLLPKDRVLVLPYKTHDPGDTDKNALREGLIKLGY